MTEPETLVVVGLPVTAGPRQMPSKQRTCALCAEAAWVCDEEVEMLAQPNCHMLCEPCIGRVVRTARRYGLDVRRVREAGPLRELFEQLTRLDADVVAAAWLAAAETAVG